jgi:uncharacterized protein YndB with AHSA1/START domain
MGTTKITAEPGLQQVEIIRDFDAPPEVLFRAYTDPELLAQWMGPRRYTMTFDHYELRDGGRWRFVHRDDDGNEYGFHGVFHGQPTIDGIVRTFEFEGAPGHVSLESATFEPKGTGTVVRATSVFQSVVDRDMMIQSGMESGVNEGFERLDAILAQLVPVG